MTSRHNQPSGITALLLTNEAGKEGAPGEPVLVTACNDCALKLWRMPGFEKRGILAARVGHSDIVRCLAKVRAVHHIPEREPDPKLDPELEPDPEPEPHQQGLLLSHVLTYLLAAGAGQLLLLRLH